MADNYGDWHCPNCGTGVDVQHICVTCYREVEWHDSKKSAFVKSACEQIAQLTRDLADARRERDELLRSLREYVWALRNTPVKGKTRRNHAALIAGELESILNA